MPIWQWIHFLFSAKTLSSSSYLFQHRFLSSVSPLYFRCQKIMVIFSPTRYRALGPELIPVYRQSAHRWLFKSFPSGRLPLLSARPSQRTSLSFDQYQVIGPTARWQRHIGVNNLLKVATQSCPGENQYYHPVIAGPILFLSHCTTIL